LGPELDAAIAADDGGAIRRLQRQLLDMQAAVDGGVRAAKPPAHARRWLQVREVMCVCVCVCVRVCVCDWWRGVAGRPHADGVLATRVDAT
jgi:hypothetical protein